MALTQKFPDPKNLVKVSRLKQIVEELKKRNYEIEQFRKNSRPEDLYNEGDQQFLREMQENNRRINKYNNVIKSGKKYKVNF